MNDQSSQEHKGKFRLGIGGKLILIFLLLSITITGVLAVISYMTGSSAISMEATNKLAAAAELKTTILETFMEDRYGDIHIMTGLDLLKKSCDGIVEDVQGSGISPSLSLKQKWAHFNKTSSNYRITRQYIDKYRQASDNFSEIKFVAPYDIKNKNGEVVFKEGDQVMSLGNFTGNRKENTMYIGGLELLENKKEGVETKKYACPFLYSSSIEYCPELKKPSIHMSHGVPKFGLSMARQRADTRVRDRFSLMMIFDINTGKMDKLIHDMTGMGESGDTFLVEEIDGKLIMLTDTRFETGIALKKDVSISKGLQDHMKRCEHKRGAGFCQNVLYKNYRGHDVLAHNHMLRVGEHDVGVITEIDQSEVFAAVSNLLLIMVVLGIIVVVIAAFVAIFFSRSLSKPLKYGVDFATAIATGDLTQTMDNKYLGRTDEIGDLTKALAKMSTDLENVVSNVILGAQNLSQAVQQIAAGNENLSQRSAEQASSLEEIASTIEETTATTNQNTDNAKEANNLADSSYKLAEEGGRVSEEAVNGINEINDVSKKIGDITSVINEISFQTNLLALNAAVEAARAGEAGRGFAVVAGEIRNLAQRSGNAAKEIEELIRDTIQKIETGSGLVNKSGESLREIIGGIGSVSKIVSEISAASDEQKEGMNQLNTAVTEMDNMTQQNAALVEETASAGEEMSNQAQELLSMTEQFKVSGEVNKTASVTRRKEVHIQAAEKAGEKKQITAQGTEEKPAAKNGDNLKDVMQEEGFEEF